MWYFDVRKDHPLTKNDIYRINVRQKFWSGHARLMRIYLLIALLFAGVLHAQVPGSVLDPAVPAINPLNPNGDGFITSSAAAFSGPSDEAEFELAFLPVQQYQAEPAADNQFAAGCQFYELVHDPATNADAAYFLYSNPDGIPDDGDELMLFRFRVARYSNGVTAFSFLIDTALITIRINDVNEPPVLTGASVSTDENNTSGTWISAVQATDPDAGAVLTYSIIAGNTGSAFVIDNATGTVTVNNAAALDFESTPTFALVIRASDGALSSEAVIQVDIRNVNEAPTVPDASPSVEFEVAKNGIAYSVVATDPDAGDVLVFALEQDNPESIFSIDPTTGDITVRDRQQLLTGSFSTSVVVRATDSGGLSDTGAINITIMPRLDRSAIAPLKGFSPNGDGQNDFWLINGIEAFPDNFIQVFNRWGILVYEASGYDNDQQAWDGAVRNTRTTEESIYFYIINAADFTPITGYVLVKP